MAKGYELFISTTEEEKVKELVAKLIDKKGTSVLDSTIRSNTKDEALRQFHDNVLMLLALSDVFPVHVLLYPNYMDNDISVYYFEGKCVFITETGIFET